jgi:hypothetical protein
MRRFAVGDQNCDGTISQPVVVGFGHTQCTVVLELNQLPVRDREPEPRVERVGSAGARGRE